MTLPTEYLSYFAGNDPNPGLEAATPAGVRSMLNGVRGYRSFLA